MQDLKELIEKLPPELQKEVRDFVEFLLERRVCKRGRKLRQDWAGALRKYRDQYTSLELQKKALEWRGTDLMYLILALILVAVGFSRDAEVIGAS